MSICKQLFISSTVLFVLASLPLISSVGAFSTMWSQTYGGIKDDRAYSLVETFDGGYAFAGSTRQPVHGGSLDFWLVKTDAYGNIAWNKTYGEGAVHSLVETSDGGYALAGNRRLVKTDSNGNMEWNQKFAGAYVDYIHSLVETSDGGFALAGGPWNDFWLVKVDGYGNKEWSRRYGAGAAYSLVETSDGGFAIAGERHVVDGDSDFWLVKTDAYGNVEWNQTYGGALFERAYSLVETSDGGFALVGFTYSFGGPFDNFWLVKTDAYGNMQWNQTYDEYECTARSLVETSNGGYVIAGYIEETGSLYDAFLIKTDEYGIIPEFPSWIILPLLLTTTSVMVILRKKIDTC